MVIRNYRPRDFPQLMDLWKETGIYTVERGDTEKIILRTIDRGGRLLVMEDPSGKVRGSSWMTWDGRRVFLHHFAIGPEIQGQGFGRRLALASLDFAATLKAPMKLEVHRENTPAVNLYRSLGFQIFEDYDTYMILDPGSGGRPHAP
jgi:ribosomal protein S18 acetylase RimI-like enzyme